MANIVIWGRARDIVTGELPPSASVEEVDSLAQLRQLLEESSSALVLADPDRLEPERAELEAWTRAVGFILAVLVAVVAHGDAEETLRKYPFLDEVLLRPVTASRLRLRLERALETVHNRRVIRQLEYSVTRKGEELKTLNKIGVALSSERDINKLLDLILAKSREITAADAGSLYLVKRGKDDDVDTDDQLLFELTQNDSVIAPFKKSTMPLNKTSIAGYAAVSGESVNVADAYNLPPDSPYKISRSFDEQSGYRTKSMLVVPMCDHLGKVIGVVQLINKKKDPETVLRPVSLVDEVVIPFTSVDKELVNSLASQAAVAFENAKLLSDIKNLFDAFVRASVTAIEQRDPTTSGHSGRVAILTVGLAEHVDAAPSGPFRGQTFTKDQLREIWYASVLHDFGKVGVKEHILLKEKKLFPAKQTEIVQRFAYIKKALEAEHLQAKLDQVLSGQASPELLRDMDLAYEQRRADIDQAFNMVIKTNEPTVEVEEISIHALMELARRTYRDVDGNRQTYLSPEEVALLSINKGNLSLDERKEINDHVSQTFRFLSQIPWTGEFKRVPEIAYAHHEKLDGSGYPRKLRGVNEIPVQSRMMTISDIYDALVDFRRPYKKSVTVERALDILKDEARRGLLDQELLEIFIEAKVYEKTQGQTGIEAEVTR